MEGEKPFNPEAVLENEGPNAGNIADGELARIGAEVENKFLDERKPESVPTLATEADASDLAGKLAMNEEIKRRAKASEQASQMTPKGKEAFGEEAVDRFSEQYYDQTSMRMKEELDRAYEKINK
jgi:hypothetical protein